MFEKIKRIVVKTILFSFLGSVGIVLVYRFVPVPLTILMVQRCVEQKIDGKSMRLEKDWVSADEISHHLPIAVVASEDQRFLYHHGFDFEAIEKAVKHNEKQKKRKKPRIRGASTISQQTAKNAFLFPARSFIRKGLEVYFTGLIELLWSKERIMTVYLNIIEMGDGIYGAEAAAQHYFGHSAARLTAAEAALLAAVLPNPRKFNAGKPSSYVRGRQANILTQMRNLGGKLDYAAKEPE